DLERRVSRVSVYCEQKIAATQLAKIAAGLQQIKRCGLDVHPAKITFARVKREDWAESWKKHFPPIAIGDALLVKPSWSRRRPGKGQAVVILDPGLSFGTGQHPTTAFCLTELVRGRAARPGQSFLDIGTGSGILAISAAKLGYQPVHAFDFDPDCVRIARENARTNDVAGTIKITRGDVARLNLKPAQQFDLVCANLISNLLLAERRKIVSQVSADGTLVLAGILRKEFSLVHKGFAEIGWDFFRGKTVNEWRSGAFRRR
ncbi:MAG TPA: 50S ribosomal protein L11 methyltransferase, partial [Candidatus Angelobacter sp.]|nr:50S ribosomal protein L11 methyltransferase [Candidatus Angelobacter sp.]